MFVCILHLDHSEVGAELHRKLRTHHAYLAENLDQTELFQRLLSEGVITTSDAECIKAEKGTFKQNYCLLDLLQSKSSRQIEMFINCLITTRQIHLAQKLDPSGKTYLI